MTEENYKSNLWKYYVFEFFMGLWFILPISVIFLKEFNVSYGQIGILEFAVSMIVILLEIPTGVFSDFIGKRTTLFFGSLFWAFAMFTIGFSSTFLFFLFGFILWGISDSLLSGTKSALVYDTLKRLNREKSYLKIRGISRFVIAISTISASLLGAYLYTADIRLPWFFFGASALVASVFILLSKEPYKNGNKFTIANQIEHTKKSLHFVLSHKIVRWVIIYSALIILPFTIFNNIIKQPYILDIGFQIISLGWITALIYGISGIFSIFSEKIESYVGEKGSFLIITVVHGLGFMLLGFINIQPMLLIIIFIYLSRIYKDNVIEYYINKHTASERRATVLSMQNLAVNIFGAIYVLVGGGLLDIFSINLVLICMGIITLVLSLGYILFKYPKSISGNNIIKN
ncbi:MAG: MFS transporter [Nanoarchaeota archaeon]|nr:MFS transporter [Nanoarchaeota archaeon]